jgi:hypothetical protein
MADCPNTTRCSLFPLLAMHGLSLLKRDFCESHYEHCERYRRSRAGRIVPMNLLPDGGTLGAVPAPAPSQVGPTAPPPADERRRA